MNSWLAILTVAVLIGFNALFVAGEFALVAVDPAKLDSLEAGGARRPRLVSSLRGRLSFHLSGAQFGITISSLVLGLMARDTIGEFLSFIPGVEADATTTAALALFVATLLQLLFGELIPKNLAIARPEGVAMWLAPVLALYGTLAGPIIRSFDTAANWVSRRLGIEPAEELSTTRSRDELAYVIRSSAQHGTLADDVQLRLERVIRFGDRDAADVLVPRASMVTIRADEPLDALAELSRESGRSRFPVVGEDLDDLIGVVEVTDVLAVSSGHRHAGTVGDLAAAPLVVPEGRPLDRLLDDFREARARLAVVVDEHGGIAGLVTLEDLLEELVGEIADEYDDEIVVTHTRRAGHLEVDAALHIDDVSDLIGARLPDGPYETVGGLVLSLAGEIPAPGTSVRHDDWEFTVLDGDHRRVTLIAVAHRPLPGTGRSTNGTHR